MKNRLIEIRKDKKISQQQLADDLSLSRTFINLVENGNRELSERTIQDICRVYNVNEVWLRTGEGDMYKPLDREEEIALIVNQILQEDDASFKRSLIKVIASLDENSLEVLKDVITKIAKENSLV